MADASGRRLGTLALAAVLTAFAVGAEEAKVHRVAVLSAATPDDPTLMGLRDGLKEAGFVEGKNLILEMATTAADDELRPLAQAYRGRNVDALVTMGDTATALAREATQEMPIVFVHALDPLRHVGSLSHPQGNVTGVMSYMDHEMQAKRLQVFKEVVPGLRRVIVLYDAEADGTRKAKNLAAVREAASRLRLTPVETPIRSAADVDQALAAVSRDRVQGIFIVCSGRFRDRYPRIAEIARQKRLPVIACSATQVIGHGGLLLYAPDSYRLGHRGAWYVARILKGTRPGQLPVEAPATFELTLNAKAAREIGLTIPAGVLMLADKVIR